MPLSSRYAYGEISKIGDLEQRTSPATARPSTARDVEHRVVGHRPQRGDYGQATAGPSKLPVFRESRAYLGQGAPVSRPRESTR